MKVSYSLPSLSSTSFLLLAMFLATIAALAATLSAFSFSFLAYSHKTFRIPSVFSEEELEQATQDTVISCMNAYRDLWRRSK